MAGVPGWVSQLSVRLLVAAQVMILWVGGSSPASDYALNRESAWDSSPLSLFPLPLSLK